MNKKILVTHIDLDGIGNIILAQEFGLEIDKYIIIDYKELEETKWYAPLVFFDEVYITDITLTQPVYEFLKLNNINYYIFDHHISTQELPVESDNRIFYDENKCGTKLFYEFLSKGKRVINIVKEFVDLVNVYDLWQKDSELWETARKLNNLMFEMLIYSNDGYAKYKPFIESQVKKFNNPNNFHFYFTDIEQIFIKRAEIKEYEVLQKAVKDIQVRKDSKGKQFALIKASSKISYVSSKILEKYTGLDYLVCINTYNKAIGKISVRTAKNDFNVNNLENIKGHTQAGGGNFDIDFVNNLWIGRIKEIGYKE